MAKLNRKIYARAGRRRAHGALRIARTWRYFFARRVIFRMKFPSSNWMG